MEKIMGVVGGGLLLTKIELIEQDRLLVYNF